MDFDLSDAQRKRCADIAAGTRERLAVPVPDGPLGHFTREQWTIAARLGLTGLCVPAGYGGGDLGALDTALSLEAFTAAGGDTGLGFGLAAHLLACVVPVRDVADADVAAELLPGAAAGAVLMANGMTEDDAGSDVATLRTTARGDGGHYVLDGVKSFVSNAPLADVIVAYATTDPSAGYLGVTAFAVPRDLPGVRVTAPMAKMGLHGCPAGRVEFDGCRLPARYRIGPEGGGSAIFQHSMAWERACLSSVYIGAMREQLDRTIAHAARRRQFGRRIGSFQAVSHTVATMHQRLEAARLLVYRACWLLDRDDPAHVAAAATAKVAASEAAVANAVDAVGVFGATGYLSGGGIEHRLRDAVPSMLVSGTTHIQRNTVARELGL